MSFLFARSRRLPAVAAVALAAAALPALAETRAG